jgi:fluoroquinolone transport system ATP-binding protein
MIKIDNLNFTYENSKKHAVKDVNFSIEKGEIFGFLGPSGAGKTTTQRLIIGLLRGYSGSIHIMDKERSQWQDDFFEKIGVAFDFPNMYLKLTGLENLELIASYYKNTCRNPKELLEIVGLDSDMNKRVEGYSKGMKMRLNFIRAFMHNPEIIFLDEPTSGLDPNNAKIVKDFIKAEKEKGKTIFLTTHNMHVAETLCDRVALIDDGFIKALDSPENLMHSHGNRKVETTYLEKGLLKTVKFSLDKIKEEKEFFEIMKTKKIHSIHSGEASLEDIFIKLTGRQLL